MRSRRTTPDVTKHSSTATSAFQQYPQQPVGTRSQHRRIVHSNKEIGTMLGNNNLTNLHTTSALPPQLQSLKSNNATQPQPNLPTPFPPRIRLQPEGRVHRRPLLRALQRVPILLPPVPAATMGLLQRVPAQSQYRLLVQCAGVYCAGVFAGQLCRVEGGGE